MQTNGLWAFGMSLGACSTLELCPICSFDQTPVFTLKGLCSEDSQLDWNYYFVSNATNQIIGYEGYKTSNLTLEGGIWTIQDIGVSAKATSANPLGRKDWHYIDRTCGIADPSKTTLTLSSCIFGTEFTCNSGECIEMSKRCNKVSDCKDASDEDGCVLVRIPNSYEKIDAPKSREENDETEKLHTRVNVITVDVIDTLKMLIGITFEIEVKWVDDRLQFENLDAKRQNLISEQISEKLWLPSHNIIHDNAILGNIISDNRKNIGIRNLSVALPVSVTNNIEDYKFKGSEAQIFVVQRFKAIYSCIFELSKFPFDTHECEFIMKLKNEGAHSSISFREDEPSITYKGENTVGQFRIDGLTSRIVNDANSTNFIFSIKIGRLYMSQMLNSFLPTALLWSVAYFTHFIDIENFSDRFIGTVTALLVLVALLSSVNGDLPKTSYFKFIDCWFLWYISTILFIILFHIFLNHAPNHQIQVFSSVAFENDRSKNSVSYREKINKLGIIIFAVTTILFNATYFYLTVI